VFLIIGIVLTSLIVLIFIIANIISAANRNSSSDYDYYGPDIDFDTIGTNTVNSDIHYNAALLYNTAANFVATESEDTFVSPEGWEVQYIIFDRHIYQCKQFTLDFNVSDIQSGSPYGEWCIYGEFNNKWSYMGSITHTEDSKENTVSYVLCPENGSYFEPFNAIAIARASAEPCEHSYSYNFHDFITDDNTLVIGASGDYVSEHYDAENGNWSGFDVDLANYVGKELGIDIEFVQIQYSEREQALQNNLIDCYWSGYSGEFDLFTNTICYASTNVTYVEEDGTETTQLENWSVVFNSGNDDLVERVNEIFLQAQQDGTIDTLAQRHGITLVK